MWLSGMALKITFLPTSELWLQILWRWCIHVIKRRKNVIQEFNLVYKKKNSLLTASIKLLEPDFGEELPNDAGAGGHVQDLDVLPDLLGHKVGQRVDQVGLGVGSQAVDDVIIVLKNEFAFKASSWALGSWTSDALPEILKLWHICWSQLHEI